MSLMGDAIARPYVSYADYLAGEQASDVKHEWFDGAVYAMSRGTPEHARLAARTVRLVGNALAGDCDVYSSDMMLYVADVKLSTYADGSVVCGPLETITVKRNGQGLSLFTSPAATIAFRAPRGVRPMLARCVEPPRASLRFGRAPRSASNCSVSLDDANRDSPKSLGEGVTNPTVIIEVLSDSTERYDREEKFGYYRHLASLQEYVLVAQDEVAVEVYRRAPGGGRWEREVGRAGGQVTIHGAAISVDDLYGDREARGP